MAFTYFSTIRREIHFAPRKMVCTVEFISSVRKSKFAFEYLIKGENSFTNPCAEENYFIFHIHMEFLSTLLEGSTNFAYCIVFAWLSPMF